MKTLITPQLITALNPSHPAPQVAASKIQTATARWGVASTRQLAMFLAMAAHESSLIPQEENLSYRASRICQVWPSRFPTLASAAALAFNPQGLANRVYAGRMGNVQPGDGWSFRGRGLFQITGRYNYVRYGAQAHFALSTAPDQLLQYGVSSEVAGAFWQDNGCNPLAERGDVAGVTRLINGGAIGLDERERLYQRALNRIARYGLLETDAPLDVFSDETTDLDMRHEAFLSTLALL